MQTSEQGIALIKKYEGFSAQAYRCPAGVWTIGYGHVIGAGEAYPQGVDQDTAEGLLKKDVAGAEQAVTRLVKAGLSQNQFDALVSFVYNLGAGALAASTLLKYLNSGDYSAAAGQFPRWNHVNGKELEGLSVRRAAEMALFLGGA